MQTTLLMNSVLQCIFSVNRYVIINFNNKNERDLVWCCVKLLIVDRVYSVLYVNNYVILNIIATKTLSQTSYKKRVSIKNNFSHLYDLLPT